METAQRERSREMGERRSEDVQQHLRHIFDLCDHDHDGVVTVDEFRTVAQQHLETAEQMDELLLELDPDKQGLITFDAFKKGIESYITSTQRHSNNSSRCSDTFSLSSLEDAEGGSSSQGEFDSVLSVEDVHQWDTGQCSFLSDGFAVNEANPGLCGIETGPVELVGHGQLEEEKEDDEEDEGVREDLNSAAMRRSSSSYVMHPTSVSPTLMAKSLMRRRIVLHVSQNSSSTSTPERRREEDSEHLSDKLLELSTRLEGLEVDLDSSQSHGVKLKKENLTLKERLEVYEDRLQEAQLLRLEDEMKAQEELRLAVTRTRREKEMEIDDLKMQLSQTQHQLGSVQEAMCTLKEQLDAVRQEREEREGLVEGLKVQNSELQAELRRVREQLKMERERWRREMTAMQQEVTDREAVVEQLRREVDESKVDRRRSSISKSDLQTSEIMQLRKEVQSLKQENEHLSAHLIQQGKHLVAPVPSLAQELEDAPKAKLMEALRDTEEVNSRLRSYIESLLVTIIDKHPELLEIK